MKIHIAIIEDESIYVAQLKEILEHWAKQLNCYIVLEEYTKKTKEFLKRNFDSYDVIFLDIQLEENLNGVSLAKYLRKKNYQGSIIFLTSHQEYVFQGYNVQALHYLMKPIKEPEIIKCMNIVFQTTRKNNYVFHYNNQTTKIPYHQILYFSSANHYIDIYTTHTSYSHKAKLAEIKCHLPFEFCQCHRSILVNMNHVEKIVKNSIYLSNGVEVPISSTYLDSVRNAFLNTIL